MIDNNKLLVIGYGNMGQAIVDRVLQLELKPHLVLQEGAPSVKAAQSKNFEYTIDVLPSGSFKYLLLAVKPQNLDDLKTYATQLLATPQNKNCVIISILAGVEIQSLRKIFPHNPIVRTMPNMALKLGKSFTMAKCDGLDDNQHSDISKFLGTLGDYKFTDQEEFLNTIIPISGSGLAYAAYFILQMINSGVRLGFPEDLSKDAVLKTVAASVELCQSDEESSIPNLISKICSKGGTTEAGIKSLEENSFSDIVMQCMQTTFKKAQELSAKAPNKEGK